MVTKGSAAHEEGQFVVAGLEVAGRARVLAEAGDVESTGCVVL